MARKPRLYQKLVRRRGTVGSHVSLWLAADHVLQVESNLFAERYQRVWFRDIQGLFVRPSREARLVTAISLGFIVLFGGLAFIGGDAGMVFGVLAGLTLPVLIYGLFFARNCHFCVLTAVQRAEWTNVARRRQARKLIAKLEPLIREAQAGEASDPASVTLPAVPPPAEAEPGVSATA